MNDKGARIYNLFPRLAGSFDRWGPHIERARDMGFDWIYVNPLHYPGFSGSLYAIKDYYKINPIFLSASSGGEGFERLKNIIDLAESDRDGFEQLRQIISLAAAGGQKFMMDLVINHTAIDCNLVRQHPAWYRWEKGQIVHPSCMDPADARKITVWGDLAEIDNVLSADRDNLWDYWEKLCLFYAELGFRGFRCDAAYQVPVELWQRLISKIKSLYPDFIFVAETLGCQEKDIVALARAGFDYLYNSSKWWDFKADWCLRQYNDSRVYAPSISFAETHDTPRLFAEADGDISFVKMRYFFSALFSKGLLLPMGFEFGFKKQLNVVETGPDWWESPGCDLTDFIKKVNFFKAAHQIFNEDAATYYLDCIENKTISGLIKISAGGEKAVILINNHRFHAQPVRLDNLPAVFQTAGPFLLISPESEPQALTDSWSAEMAPSEIKIIIKK